jgi:hypothetical protein
MEIGDILTLDLLFKTRVYNSSHPLWTVLFLLDVSVSIFINCFCIPVLLSFIILFYYSNSSCQLVGYGGHQAIIIVYIIEGTD